MLKRTKLQAMNKKVIIISAIAAAIIGALAYLYFDSRSEMQEMVEVFTEEKENLLNEYQDLYLDYDSLKNQNTDLSDKLELERERIAQLKEELQTVKATNARRIKELQEELTTMRTVMRSFVMQIDSLNQRNIQLSNENKDMRTKVAQVQQSYKQLEKEKETLSEQVTIASRLEANSISVEGLTYKEKKTTAYKKVTKIKVSFQIAKNGTAKVGMKNIYIRITRPDNHLLMHSKNDTFKYEDTNLNYSAMRAVEYGGEEASYYIIYDVDSGELMEGSYDVEIFCEGERIGQK